MDHATYVGMAEPIRKTHTVLMDNSTMADEIDRVIEAGVKSRLPVYIYIPMDSVFVPVDVGRLENPLNLEIKNPDRQVEDEIIQSTLDLIKKSSNPAILADVLTIRHCGKGLVNQLAKLTKFPVYSTPLSKGVFDETSELFNGLYNGSGMSHSPRSQNLANSRSLL
jgi:pyruvate decarboxylase